MSSLTVTPYSYNGIYRNILPPLPDRTAISMGMFRVPSSDPLASSNTAYGTNANAEVGGYRYISSADFLELMKMIDGLKVDTEKTVKNEEMSQAIDIAIETDEIENLRLFEDTFNVNETEKFFEQTSIENELLEIEDQETLNLSSVNNLINSQALQQITNLPETNPIEDRSSDLQEKFYYQNRLFLSGSNSSLDFEGSEKFAAVNAGYNVAFSEGGSEMLKSLNNIAALEHRKKLDLSRQVDGMIPVSAATLFDFSSITESRIANQSLIKRMVSSLEKLTNSRSYGQDYQ